MKIRMRILLILLAISTGIFWMGTTRATSWTRCQQLRPAASQMVHQVSRIETDFIKDRISLEDAVYRVQGAYEMLRGKMLAVSKKRLTPITQLFQHRLDLIEGMLENGELTPEEYFDQVKTDF